MLIFLLFLSLSEAAFITSPLGIKQKSFSRTTSASNLKTSTSNEKLTSPRIRENTSCDSFKSTSTSSPRQRVKSEPIPIPYTDEALQSLKSDPLRRTDSVNWNLFIEKEESPTSSPDSSDSSLGGLSIFEMSYDPIYEEFKKKKQAERENRRKLKRELKDADTAAEKIKFELLDPDLFFTKEEEEDLRNRSKEREYHCRFIPNADLNTETNNSDLDNDSDFGGEARKEECYSLSL